MFNFPVDFALIVEIRWCQSPFDWINLLPFLAFTWVELDTKGLDFNFSWPSIKLSGKFYWQCNIVQQWICKSLSAKTPQTCITISEGWSFPIHLMASFLKFKMFNSPTSTTTKDNLLVWTSNTSSKIPICMITTTLFPASGSRYVLLILHAARERLFMTALLHSHQRNNTRCNWVIKKRDYWMPWKTMILTQQIINFSQKHQVCDSQYT